MNKKLNLLFLYIKSDYNLYINHLLPFLNVFHKNYLDGIYNSQKALNACYKICCTGAKEYAIKAFQRQDWENIFTVNDRKILAKKLKDLLCKFDKQK